MHPSNRGAVNRRLLLGLLVLVAIGLGLASRSTCLSVGFSKGLWLDRCPDGELRQTIAVSAPQLTRGGSSWVVVSAQALYVVAPSESVHSEPLTRFTPVVSLVGPTGETVLQPKTGWVEGEGGLKGELTLPKVNDGDYTLRTKITSAIGDAKLDLPLSLYTPARVHVLTDRPLYEPGNTVQFRAVVLRASDLAPLEERPGVWEVTNANGEVLLEEKAASGPWGVVVGTFPLDRGATSGTWNVAWRSGGQVENRSFEVKPFTLPRFRVEASTSKAFYRRLERPVVRGQVSYSSGAPVANAKIDVTWFVNGAWPAPTSWTEGTVLPRTATSSASGEFVLELPQVPDDLQGQATLTASIGAVDPSGDRVEGRATVLLSQDAIAVEGVTELANGLVEGMNNRLFVRTTTADGQVLEGVTLQIKRMWEPSDPGTSSTADEDGVASLQIDPGPAVNVIIPAMPFRPPPPTPLVQQSTLSERLHLDPRVDEDEGEGVSLADRMTFDRALPRLQGCARYVLESGVVEASLAVRNSGAVSNVTAPSSRLGRCVEPILRSLQFGSGVERFFDVTWDFDDADLPGFNADVEGAPSIPPELQSRLDTALLDARDCLPATVKSGALPRLLRWSVDASGTRVSLDWVPVQGDSYSDSALSCIQSRVSSLTLPKGPPEDESVDPPQRSIGFARVSVEAPEKYESVRPQDTVMVGYEFSVTAKKGNETLGTTRLRMTPGAVPSIRLRASSQLVKPGEQVTVEIVRGPDFTGDLPEKLYLTHAFETLESKVDEKTRAAAFTVPTTWQGWAGVQWGGGQVFLFVKSETSLTVSVKPEKPRYAPGQVAQLSIETAIGGKGGPAAVGLFGVDESLSQLAALPGADEFSGLLPKVTGVAAFGALDAQALSLGRIRGANATAATLARVSALPPPPQLEAAVAVSGRTTFDPNEAQVDRFYAVLGELYGQVRTWETTAPANEKLQPRTLANLWTRALDAVAARKEPVDDAWGRRLRLHRLPADLLALTEPRAVIVNGTRLPEDNQNWAQWVAKEKP